MINRVVLVGRLTRDPELRKTPSGASVCSYTLAVSRNRSAQPGQPEADFINCVTWNRQAETMAQYLHKGSLLGIEGRIQTRNMQNANPYGSASSYSQPDYVDDAFGSFDSNDTLDIASDDLPF